MKKMLPLLFLCMFSCSGFIPKKKVRIGIDPFFIESPVGNRQDSIYAFTNELLEEIFKGTRFEIIYQDLSYDNMMLGLDDETTDLIVSSMDMLYEAKKDFTFSSMFLSLGDVFVTRKDMIGASFDDFSGKIIAMQDDPALVASFAPYPKVSINYYSNITMALEEVASKKVDGALIPYISLSSFLSEEYRYLLKFSTNRFTDTGLRLLSLKNAQNSAMHTFNKRLYMLKEDGTLQKLLTKRNLIL